MEIRTVGGRRYNLDTAKKVGTSADATLYRKKNGEFFLHREGENKIESLIVRDDGPETPAAGDSHLGSGKLLLSLLAEEEYLSAFEYSDKKQQVLYSLPQYAIEKLRTMAGDRRVSASQLITDLIMGAIDDVHEEVEKPAPIRARLIDAKEGANYCGVSVPTFKKWADEIGATRHIRKSVRYDLTAIDEALNK